MTIAPWIQPTDFLRPAQAGASVGLQVRGQDAQEQEAADRLRLAYEQLNREDTMRSKELQSRQQLAAATMMMRSQQMDMLQRHRQEMEALTAQRQADLTNYRTSALAQAAQLAELRKRNIHFAPNGEVLQVNDDGSVTQIRKPEPKAATPKEPSLTFPLDPDNPYGAAKITGPLSDPEIAKRYKAATAGKGPQPAASAGAGASLMDTLAPGGLQKSLGTEGFRTNANPSPFKEGETIRSKKDGKLYQIQNGQPVLLPNQPGATEPNPAGYDRKRITEPMNQDIDYPAQ